MGAKVWFIFMKNIDKNRFFRFFGGYFLVNIKIRWSFYVSYLKGTIYI